MTCLAETHPAHLAVPLFNTHADCWEGTLREDGSAEFRHYGLVVFRLTLEDVARFTRCAVLVHDQAMRLACR